MPQPAAAAAKPFSPRRWPRRLRRRRSGTVAIKRRADHQSRAAAGEQRIEPGAEHAGRQRADDRDHGAARFEQAAERDNRAPIGEHRRNGDDRHHRRGADHRHQDERHQRTGAIAGDPAGDGREGRQGDDDRQLE